MPPIHPDLAAVASLLGSWSGTGEGEYPTIADFGYSETITFGHVGKPFLAYSQRTRSLPNPDAPPEPLHAEVGYWRFPAPGRVEIVLVHPTGVTEIEEGTIQIDESGIIRIDVATTDVSLTASAKSVTALERHLVFDGDRLDYRLSMAAVGLPLQHHLAASLTRQRSD